MTPTIQDVERLADKLMGQLFEIKDEHYNTHWLSAKELGYTFKFDRAVRRFGCCNYVKRTISLSRPLCLNNLDKLEGKITDTILHEIAHAFSVEVYGRKDGSGHGYRWVSIAKQIGCNGERCYTNKQVDAVQAKYTIYCDAGHEIARHKRPKNLHRKSCPYCSNRYNPKYALEYRQNF